ncbi:PepSY domain-containing protein [Olivibacter sp. XZL3]|uniref:PepSY-associated TM helix domain-containing protein n=1 Tax=Olivibacter sp. XZL3 TaxID=1735116 RepID=UPI001416F543|nr:PepSY-associated TM helix domain-containing protein [Olivibacter sp. XZL3]
MKKRLLKINAFLHRWLGLLSGLVVFILGITGCILTFQSEIEDYREPWRRVERAPAFHESPKKMGAILLDSLPKSDIRGLRYLGKGRSVVMDFVLEGKPRTAFVDPYQHRILKIKENTISFFPVVLHLHVNLLLPGMIGHAIISYATLVYIVLLLGGLVLWWPKKWNKRLLRNALTMKWGAGPKRVNYDLHNVPGFYAFLPFLVIACTGIFISLSWFSGSVYWLASGGKQLPKRELPKSIVQERSNLSPMDAVDSVWQLLGADKHRPDYALSFVMPDKEEDVVTVTDNPAPETAHLAVIRHFDRYSLKPISMPHYWQKDIEQANGGDWIGRYNYDVHVGRIGGIGGKCLAFMISLVCASLPITGFFIWYNKRTGKKR